MSFQGARLCLHRACYTVYRISYIVTNPGITHSPCPFATFSLSVAGSSLSFSLSLYPSWCAPSAALASFRRHHQFHHAALATRATRTLARKWAGPPFASGCTVVAIFSLRLCLHLLFGLGRLHTVTDSPRLLLRRPTDRWRAFPTLRQAARRRARLRTRFISNSPTPLRDQTHRHPYLAYLPDRPYRSHWPSRSTTRPTARVVPRSHLAGPAAREPILRHLRRNTGRARTFRF